MVCGPASGLGFQACGSGCGPIVALASRLVEVGVVQ